MTELFIDGTSVVLSKDFNIQVKRENPLFTKNGEYTYDITLPLDNATNAELYGHLNRLNSTQAVSTDRRAVLVADNRVYCNGTEIITGWTENTVSIQIASGNSELNWLIGADLQVSFLEMKQTEVPEDAEAKKAILPLAFPDTEYCLAPVIDQGSGYTYNLWMLMTGEEQPLVQGETTYIAQPYLCAYVKEVLKGIGYTLTTNELESTVFKDVYIVHAQNTGQWAKMLPGWSVRDFLEQVEQLFDMVFVVDNKRREAALVFKGQFLDGGHTVHVQPVEDVYESETEEDTETEDLADSNISYALPDDEFWKFACLSEEVKKVARQEEIPEDFDGKNTDRILAWFNNESHRRTDTLYKDNLTGRKYLYLGLQHEEVQGGTEFVMVDQFAQLQRTDATAMVELETQPATLADGTVRKYDGYDDQEPTMVTIQFPAIGEGSGTEEPSDEVSLPDIIRGGAADSSSSKSSLSLAIYSGLSDIRVDRESFQYPIPYIDEYRRRETYHEGVQTTYVRTNSVGASLRLSTLDQLIYQSSYDIDYRHAIKMTCHDPNLYDARYIFEIRNKRYVCREMEFTLDANGRKGAWTGTFYPIRISDTEADARWILTDGRWRDGGVWLDNGRWLDDPV